jgi:EAL domain-containing protein (putative c-di-GMP-specific phosphodiesterase class I)
VLPDFAVLMSRLAPAGASRFRNGGDEFALLLHGLDGPESLKLADSIRVAASESLGKGVTVTAGVATLDAGTRDHSLLLREADAALYEGKMRGRNLAVLYSGDGHAPPLFPAAKLQAVRNLLEEGRIDAVFQPIWDLHSHSLLGYEGLSRPAPQYGLDGPQQAFDIAEQFGHAADLDKLCRNHLLAAARGLTDQPRLFLNLSPYSLTHQSFSPATLSAELAAASIEKSRVVFEITETSTVPTSAIAEAVVALRSDGFSVALDDVGSGNSGLEMLRKVSFDYVKIDRGVILAAAESGNGRAGLMAILAFASESGAVVVAEGIEDADMFDLVCLVASQTSLRGRQGLIHGVQGYLFGRPLPAALTARELPPELAA